MTPGTRSPSAQGLDAMLMPPPSKKQRLKVDLSYVAPGPGVGFLGEKENDLTFFGGGGADVQQQQQMTFVSQEDEFSQQSSQCDFSQQSQLDDDQQELAQSSQQQQHNDDSTSEGPPQEDSALQRQDSLNSTYTAQEQQEGDGDGDTTQTTSFDFTTVHTSLSDIIGHGNAKVRIDEVLLPLALPPSLSASILVGVRAMPASILMYGPPGCGKTQLARAIAGESQAAFVSIGPSQVLSKYVGQSESCIKALFMQARIVAKSTDSKCAVIFFDEIDALGMTRSVAAGAGNNGGVSRNILTELLIQLSSLGESSSQTEDDNNDARVIVVAATNRLEDCDEALIRRFAIQLSIGHPTFRDRCKIFKKFFKDFTHSIGNVELKELSNLTEGWSGSDLESFVREAAMTPIRECLRKAATTKRQARKSEDSSEASCQVAKDVLMEEFHNLRPVTVDDFRNAMRFFVGDAQSDGAEDGYDSDSSSESAEISS